MSSPKLYTPEEIRSQVRRLGWWYQSFELPGGVMTSPADPPAWSPEILWNLIEPCVPADLTGKTVLDVGGGAGYFSTRMMKRGAAKCTIIEPMAGFAAQARFVAEVYGYEIAVVNEDVHTWCLTTEDRFDYVIFLGLFYHLKYPNLVLDRLAEMTRERMYFQSHIVGGDEAGFEGRGEDDAILRDPAFPRMAFIEDLYNGDPTNWWVPNATALEPLVRSAGMKVIARPHAQLVVAEPERVMGKVVYPKLVFPRYGKKNGTVHPAPRQAAPEPRANHAIDSAAQFLEETRTFAERVRELALPAVSSYYWYHTIDLGNGLITPGLHDYRGSLPDFQFPEDMRGMTVLDVGSATGFFAFEFERRGARVVSTELPSLNDLDRFPGQSVENSLRKIERMLFPDGLNLESLRRVDSERELYRCLLDGPFHFCKERLGSRVERCYSTIYNLSAEKAGVPEGFDLVFVGDVLVHTLDPLRALAALAPLCRGTLVLAGILPEGPENLDAPPAMIYVGGGDPEEDHISWWLPNKACLTEMLTKLGFATVEHVGWHSGLLQPGDHPFKRAIFHARKQSR